MVKVELVRVASRRGIGLSRWAGRLGSGKNRLADQMRIRILLRLTGKLVQLGRTEQVARLVIGSMTKGQKVLDTVYRETIQQGSGCLVMSR